MVNRDAKLRVGVVGVGHLGKHHARIYHSLEGVELTGVVDIDPKKAEEIAAANQTKSFVDFHEIFGRVDAVSVAVPTSAHVEIASEFVKRGIHVLVEKPLAKSPEEAKKLVALAAEHKAILQVGHVERFNPAVTAVQEVIGSPRFLECHRLAPFSFRSVDIDVVMDLMIHDIDIILHLVKSPLKKVDAVGVSLLFGKEDIANARLEFEDGCVANVTASRISEKAMRKMRIFSEDSYASVDFQEKSVRLFKRSGELKGLKLPVDRAPSLADLASLPKEFYSVKDLTVASAEPLAEELKAFVRAVKTGSRPIVSGDDALRAMETAAAILREIRDHAWK